jgi:acyl carrier protein
MRYEEALQRATEILQHRAKLDRPITPKDNIQSDLGLDSLEVMEVVADVEDQFQIEVPTESLERLVTVEDVAREVLKISSASA